MIIYYTKFIRYKRYMLLQESGDGSPESGVLGVGFGFLSPDYRLPTSSFNVSAFNAES